MIYLSYIDVGTQFKCPFPCDSGGDSKLMCAFGKFL